MIKTELLPALSRIASEAGALIMGVYARDFEVEFKGDDSPLTQADLLAHRHIVEALQALTPDVPVISEESADIAADERLRWPRLWLVDPLDGTREFIKKNGEFTVNIALIEEGWPTMGVVHAPAQQRTWAAAQGLGAWVEDAQGRSAIRTLAAPSPLRVAASRSHLDDTTRAAMQRMGDTESVGVGSSLKFCLLAEGRIDVYPRFAPTMEWDTAAGQCLVEQAGGVVLELDGSRKRYNQRDTLLNGHFIALGDAGLSWRSWL